MNKKGNFMDIIEYLKIAIMVGIVLAMVLVFVSKFDAQVQVNAEIPATVKTISSNYNTDLPKVADYLLPALYLLFVGFSVFSARLIPSSPLYIFVAIAFMIIIPIASLIIENIWDGFYQQSAISSVVSVMTFTPFLLNNLIYFALFYTFAVGVALLSKEG